MYDVKFVQVNRIVRSQSTFWYFLANKLNGIMQEGIIIGKYLLRRLL